MKILFTGYHNPHFLTITEYIEFAITQLGHECIAFDDRQYFWPGRLRNTISFFEDLDFKRMNASLLKLAQSERPDILLVTGGHRIDSETVKQIKELGVKTVLWTIDVPSNFDPVKKAAPIYDAVFCGGTEAIPILAEVGVDAKWLPFACDPDYCQTPELTTEDRSDYQCDLSFVGSYYPSRHQIASGLSDINFKVWGPGWECLAKDDPLLKCIHHQQTPPDIWQKIYAASKATLVIHFKDSVIPSRQASPKLYEALACGALTFVDDQEDAKQLFEDQKHVVFFSNAQDLKQKLDHYISSPEKVALIAQAGQKEVLEKHTYAHRIKCLFKELGYE